MIAENNPVSKYRFVAKIGDSEIYFSEVSGLSLEYETTEYKESGMKGVSNTTIIGNKNTPSLTMKRGLFKKGLELYD